MLLKAKTDSKQSRLTENKQYLVAQLKPCSVALSSCWNLQHLPKLNSGCSNRPSLASMSLWVIAFCMIAGCWYELVGGSSLRLFLLTLTTCVMLYHSWVLSMLIAGRNEYLHKALILLIIMPCCFVAFWSVRHEGPNARTHISALSSLRAR